MSEINLTNFISQHQLAPRGLVLMQSEYDETVSENAKRFKIQLVYHLHIHLKYLLTVVQPRIFDEQDVKSLLKETKKWPSSKYDHLLL